MDHNQNVRDISFRMSTSLYNAAELACSRNDYAAFKKAMIQEYGMPAMARRALDRLIEQVNDAVLKQFLLDGETPS